jgi:tetratricopeptide (TPR) repeat protein
MDTLSHLPEWAEVASNWDLDRLLYDLGNIKTRELSQFEQKCLCALLCRRDIQYIASQINWTVAAVRTELSRGLYQYLKVLTGRTHIIGKQIADWLELKYKKPKSYSENLPLDEIERKYRAASIVAFIEKQMLEGNSSADKSADVSADVEVIIKYGDLQVKEENYRLAIPCYIKALTKDAWCMGVLNKIALCYDAMQLYEDVEFLCTFALRHALSDEVKAKAYNLKGGALHERALRSSCDLHIQNAILCYKSAINLSTELDVIPAWNIIDLLLAFSQRNSIYINSTKLEFKELKKIALNCKSNFPKMREKILKDADRAINLLEADEQEWWRQQLAKL